MRYVHFLNSVDPNLGGVTTAVTNICSYLHREGVDVCLITRKRFEHVQDWTLENKEKPTLVELPGQPARRGWLTQEDCRFLDDWLQPDDLAHLHGIWEPACNSVARICRRQKVPYCVSSHGMLDEWSMSQKWLKKRLFWHLFGKKYLGNAFAIHSTAQEEKRQIEPWVLGTRVEVVPLIFEVDTYSNLPGPELAEKKWGLSKDQKTVLFLSRIHLKKGVKVFVDAIKLVREKYPKVRALLAGPGEASYVAEIDKQIRHCGLEDCVELVGPVHGQEKLSLYQRADVFALPTSQENFGFVLPEAMACGTPVITAKGVDIWRELQEGGAQIVDRTADAFAKKILELLQDDAMRDQLGKQGRQWVFDKLPPTEVIQQFLTMYELGKETKNH